MASGPGFPGPDRTRSRRRARLQRPAYVRGSRSFSPAGPRQSGGGGERSSRSAAEQPRPLAEDVLRMCEGRREARPPTRAASSCPIMILSRISGTLASTCRCANKSTPSAWPERTQLCNCESRVKRTAAKRAKRRSRLDRWGRGWSLGPSLLGDTSWRRSWAPEAWARCGRVPTGTSIGRWRSR